MTNTTDVTTAPKVELNSVETVYSEIEKKLKESAGVDQEVLDVLKKHFLNTKVDKTTTANAIKDLSKLATTRAENDKSKPNNT